MSAMASIKAVVRSVAMLGAILTTSGVGYCAQSIRSVPSNPSCDAEKKASFAEPQRGGATPFADSPECDGEKKPDTKPKS